MTSAFDTHVEEIVTDFLETALVVDDEGFPLEAPKVVDDKPVAVRSREDLELVEPPPEELAEAEAEHPLRTKALIDAFADMGIVCGVLAPLEGDAIRERLLKAAARADLLVLDWELHRDGGATALELIKALLEQDDAAERRRLRIIAIYTGQTGLASIVRRVRESLGSATTAVADDGMTLTSRNVRVVAFSKRLGDPTESKAPREVVEADLPSRLAREFAQLTSGLMPGVALAALAAVRNETHRLLQALRADMDLGYLGHRVASPFPEDAERHLVDVVAAEIGSVLGDGEVGSNASLEVIRKWLEASYTGASPLESGSALPKPMSIGPSDLERMLTIGLGRDSELEGFEHNDLSRSALKNKVRPKAAHLFTNTPTEADRSSDVFALRMATRTLYRRPARVLQLGTLVLFQGEFMVCVQPRCDSVRIDLTEERGFPFLPLAIVGDDGGRHQYTVANPDGSGFIRLRLQCKPFAIRTYPFKPDESRSIRARDVKGRWNFYATGRRRFQWVADLKPEFAQRVAVDLAAEIARVGLDESELVRLSQ